MAINIFSGSQSSGKKTGVNKASNSQRAQQAKAALSPTAEVSSSGNTAVESKNTLSKIGNAVGTIAGIAGKFLPGVGGTIANGIANLFNDPEWWQSTPGDALTLNEPLRLIEEEFAGNKSDLRAVRSAILEFATLFDGDASSSVMAMPQVACLANLVILPTERMITQYLMPQIRKVVNAIPLQAASDYLTVFSINATIYAMWRQLRKIDYMCKHGQTYLANMNDAAFPLFQNANAAWLQSTINRLEEYLRANVRLPHTLCEYLAWRFGRVYKSNSSVKSALVIYDYIPLTMNTEFWDTVIAALMTQVSSTASLQQANADLYNTYFDHDFMVEVRDDTQFRYDVKEFMLRLNLTGGTVQTSGFTPSAVQTLVALDSALDNPTAFMASTVSATGVEQSGEYEVLFPVSNLAAVYVPYPEGAGQSIYEPRFTLTFVSESGWKITGDFSLVSHSGGDAYVLYYPNSSKLWLKSIVRLDNLPPTEQSVGTGYVVDYHSMTWAKAVDLYNIHICVPYFMNGQDPQSPGGSYSNATFLDLTALSIDAGSPTFRTINTEHVYAFANLVDIERKTSMSYKQAEHLVARDTANLIDSLDVASAATPGSSRPSK